MLPKQFIVQIFRSLLVLVAAHILSGCATAVPTVSPGIFNTSVAQTVEADFTRTAIARPTETPTSPATPTETPTITPSSTTTETPTATLTPTLALTQRLIWPRAIFSPGDVSWAPTDTWCALRGENLSCEFEYRKDNQNCYVGMTCYDACGWFYSVDTIPAGVKEFSGPCW